METQNITIPLPMICKRCMENPNLSGKIGHHIFTYCEHTNLAGLFSEDLWHWTIHGPVEFKIWQKVCREFIDQIEKGGPVNEDILYRKPTNLFEQVFKNNGNCFKKIFDNDKNKN